MGLAAHTGCVKEILPEQKERIRKYKDFVNQEDKADLLKQLESTRWPSIIGSKNFIEKIKSRFFTEEHEDEIPESRILAPEIDIIKQVILDAYGTDENVLLASRRRTFNEPRNVAIYSTRMLRFDTLNEIGTHFNMKKYSTVSSVIEQMKKLVKTDRKLRRRIEELKKAVLNSQN